MTEDKASGADESQASWDEKQMAKAREAGAAPYVFQSDGESIFIRYDGVTIGRFKGKGFGMLHALLSHPGAASTPEALHAGGVAATAGDSGANEEQCRHMMQCVTGMDAMREQLLASGTSEGAPELQELDTQKAHILSQIEALKGGAEDAVGDPGVAVGTAIESAIDKVRKSHPAAADHLRACIKVDAAVVYEPPAEPLPWVT